MATFFRRKPGVTYLAHQLTFRAVVLVEIDTWGIAARTFAVFIDVAFRSAFDRLDWFEIILIASFKVSHEVAIIPWFNI